MTTILLAAVLATQTFPRGTTFLDKPIVLTPEDSGRTFVGEEGAVVSAGVKIGPWTKVGEVWEAPAPKNADGSTMFFDQLWVGERRATNARIPNEGYLETTNAVQTKLDAPTKDGKTFREEVWFADPAVDALASVTPEERADVQIGVVLKWSYAQRNLSDFDPAARKVTCYSVDEWIRWKNWAKAEWQGDFKHLVVHKDERPAVNATEFALAADATTLYLGVKCHETQMDRLRAIPPKPISARVS